MKIKILVTLAVSSLLVGSLAFAQPHVQLVTDDNNDTSSNMQSSQLGSPADNTNNGEGSVSAPGAPSQDNNNIGGISEPESTGSISSDMNSNNYNSASPSTGNGDEISPDTATGDDDY